MQTLFMSFSQDAADHILSVQNGAGKQGHRISLLLLRAVKAAEGADVPGDFPETAAAQCHMSPSFLS